MWKVLTYEDKILAKKKIKRKAIRNSLFVSLFTFIFAILEDRYLGSGRIRYDPNLLSEAYPPQTWDEIASNIHMYLILSVLMGLFVYLFVTRERSVTRICISCENRDHDKLQEKCKCGENLYNLDDLSWIE